MLLEEGRLPEAEDIFRNALYHEPGNADIHYCLATDLATQNRYAEAEAECRRVLAIQPCYSKAYQQLAWCFDAQKRYDDAEKLLRQGIKRCPKDAALYNWLGYILSELNNSSTGKLDDKQDKEIETAFRQAMAIDPHDLYAYFHLGDFLQKRGRYTEAEETYRQIIIKDPNSAAAYSSLGLLLHEKLERYPEAEEAYRQAINKDSNCAIAYYNLGLLFHEKLDRYAEAEEAYRQAIAKAPNDVAAYYNLSIMLRLIGRWRDAIPLLEKMITLVPNDFIPYLSIVSIQKHLGETPSEEYLAKAQTLLPNDDWYDQACLNSVCGKLDVAFDNLAKAALNDNFDRTWGWQDPDSEWLRADLRFEKIVGPKPEK
jgi:tetratricopeptide (TPR) repeat protein